MRSESIPENEADYTAAEREKKFDFLTWSPGHGDNDPFPRRFDRALQPLDPVHGFFLDEGLRIFLSAFFFVAGGGRF